MKCGTVRCRKCQRNYVPCGGTGVCHECFCELVDGAERRVKKSIVRCMSKDCNNTLDKDCDGYCRHCYFNKRTVGIPALTWEDIIAQPSLFQSEDNRFFIKNIYG